ncbi:MAG: hypothetical protein IJ315_01340 [Firmicutes bacterium]|nr:hypothetical protein [Bacillota bacterium]
MAKSVVEYYNEMVHRINDGCEVTELLGELCPQLNVELIEGCIEAGEKTMKTFQARRVEDAIAEVKEKILTQDMDEEEMAGCVLQVKQAIERILFDAELDGEEIYNMVTSQVPVGTQLTNMLQEYSIPMVYDSICSLLESAAEDFAPVMKNQPGLEKLLMAVSLYQTAESKTDDFAKLAGYSVGVMSEAYREVGEILSEQDIAQASEAVRSIIFLAGMLVVIAAIVAVGVGTGYLMILAGVAEKWLCFIFAGALACASVTATSWYGCAAMLELAEWGAVWVKEKGGPRMEALLRRHKGLKLAKEALSQVAEKPEREYEAPEQDYLEQMIEVWD